jgi:hypothetical protein
MADRQRLVGGLMMNADRTNAEINESSPAAIAAALLSMERRGAVVCDITDSPWIEAETAMHELAGEVVVIWLAQGPAGQLATAALDYALDAVGASGARGYKQISDALAASISKHCGGAAAVDCLRYYVDHAAQTLSRAQGLVSSDAAAGGAAAKETVEIALEWRRFVSIESKVRVYGWPRKRARQEHEDDASDERQMLVLMRLLRKVLTTTDPH